MSYCFCLTLPKSLNLFIKKVSVHENQFYYTSNFAYFIVFILKN